LRAIEDAHRGQMPWSMIITDRLAREQEPVSPSVKLAPFVTDFLSKETRSRVMARIRSKDTAPEVALRRALYAAGARGWRCHVKHIPGKPDIAFTRKRVAVFVDGCFWHGHPDYFTPGKSGFYWDAKIARTQERDRLANEALAANGWRVLRVWDFEVEEDVTACAAKVMDALAEGRADYKTSVAAS
jgi:DNA mismatch endonuclease (patch repair protein)